VPKSTITKSIEDSVLGSIKLPLLLFHILILLSGLSVYLAALTLFNVFNNNSGIELGARGIAEFVFTGFILLVAVVDMIFVYLKFDKIKTTIMIFLLLCVMFIFLWITYIIYGHRVMIPIRRYFVYFGLIIVASNIYGYIVKLKVIDKL